MPIVERPYAAGYQQEQPSDRHTGPIIIPVPQSPARDHEPIIVHVVQSPPTQEQRYEQPVPTARPERERAQQPRTPDRATPASDQRHYSPEETNPITSRRRPTDREAISTPEQKELAEPTKTVPEPNKKSSPNNLEPEQKQLGPRIDSELIEPDKPTPQASTQDWEKVGKVVGRQRRYDELGEKDIEPIRELFLLRHLTGKHWPGLSKDMEAYYEKFYFTRPKKGSKDYAKHVKCWERRTRWIAGHTSA